MTAIWAVCGLAVPWAAGAGLAALLRDRGTSRLLVIGAGWLAGQVMMMALLYGSLLALGHGHARMVLGALAVIAVILWVAASGKGLPLAVGARRDSRTSERGGGRKWKVVRQAGLAIIAASLLAKLYLLAGAHAYLPVRNDDAVSIWLFKAKVIAGLDQLPLDPKGDYYQAGSNPRYAVFVSLAAGWIPLVTGEWHEQLATLPWLAYYVNLILLIAGGLRRWLTAGQAWVAAYLAATLPLAVVHGYRPGYADLIQAAFLAGAVLYLLAWRSTGLLRHLAMALPLVLAAACLKRESPPIAAIAVLVILAASWRMIRAWAPQTRLAASAAMAGAVLIVVSVVDFSEQAEAAGALRYHPGVWGKLGQHVFGWSSFHLLFWLVAAAVVAAAFLRGGGHIRPALLLTVGLCGFHAAVFVFTPQARFALNDQTPSRLFLQLAPCLIVAWAAALGAVEQIEKAGTVVSDRAGAVEDGANG